jgi:hypothetical protein
MSNRHILHPTPKQDFDIQHFADSAVDDSNDDNDDDNNNDDDDNDVMSKMS